MVNHEGKANRRFPRRVQVRIRGPGKRIQRNGGLVRPQVYLSSNYGTFVLAKIRDKIFNGRLV
jgi:hypothetical protein